VTVKMRRPSGGAHRCRSRADRATRVRPRTWCRPAGGLATFLGRAHFGADFRRI